MAIVITLTSSVLILGLRLIFSFFQTAINHVLAEWVDALDSRSFVLECEGSTASVPNYLIWDGGHWRDSVSSASVDPALNGYLEKSGEGK